MRKLTFTPLVGVLLLAICTPVPAHAQVALERLRSGTPSSGTTHYQYLFENERFTTSVIEVLLDGQGHGRFRFRKKDSEEIANDLSVSMSLVNQIQSLFDEVRFLDTNEDYQYKKDFSHLGKVTLKLIRDGRQRSATFNYSSNQAINRLTDIFRNIAGLSVSPDGVVSLTRGAASLTDDRCVPALFIDNIRMETTLDIVRPHEIRGIEIYKSAGTVPPQYNDICGAIVIWTK